MLPTLSVRVDRRNDHEKTGDPGTVDRGLEPCGLFFFFIFLSRGDLPARLVSVSDILSDLDGLAIAVGTDRGRLHPCQPAVKSSGGRVF